MERSFEPVLSRATPLGKERLTATAERVARETEIGLPTIADPRRWLEANAGAAAQAAFLWWLAHAAHPIREAGIPTWDAIVRLGPDNYPLSCPRRRRSRPRQPLSKSAVGSRCRSAAGIGPVAERQVLGKIEQSCRSAFIANEDVWRPKLVGS